ncbi:MAG: hypothetical protein MUF13_11950, partial [Akkermansiaceae bacterium]|nr:hypothetical protein [Akkermansiaceae bacterium]
LPALPAAWKSGSISGLRSRGGVEVDITWKDGKLSQATLTSKAGGKTYLRLNGKIQSINLPPNGKHEVR